MVNIATIALTHVIMLLAAWRLLARQDLDRDPPATTPGDKAKAARESDPA